MSLDPTDVYPERNLLGPSEDWGRQIENDQVLLKEKTASNSQSIQATNRNIAASLANISEQLNNVATAQADITDILATMAIPALDTDNVTTWGWDTGGSIVASAAVPVPSDAVSAFIIVSMNAYYAPGMGVDTGILDVTVVDTSIQGGVLFANNQKYGTITLMGSTSTSGLTDIAVAVATLASSVKASSASSTIDLSLLVFFQRT